LAKDFVETAEGLVFAVVENGIERGRVLAFLRYWKTASGWQKLSTQEANDYLQAYHPDYLCYSANKDAHLHAVAIDRITRHYQPKQILQNILQTESDDQVIKDCQQLCSLFSNAGLDLQNVGVTGSLLINAQKQSSDIDVVIYDRSVFYKLREYVKKWIGQDQLKELSKTDWQTSYQRRSCELSFSEYVWHEQRKYNKAVINGRKFDLNFVDPLNSEENTTYTKLGPIKIQGQINDDDKVFDYPAIFGLDSQEAQCVVSYTATYTGQAFVGERVEIAGQLERADHGQYRIIVGASREAVGEYIKVISR
jgi:predicted nucleotidyltransferase